MDPLQPLVPDCLPEELQLEILYRLPVKSLLRCMCACKSWLSFIKSPTFVSTHLNRSVSSAKDQPLFLFRRYSCLNGFPHSQHYYSLHFNDRSFKCYMKLPNPPRKPSAFAHEIIGSCNGIVCLADTDLRGDRMEKFFLWNPSFGKLMTLPRPEVSPKTHSISRESQGFGFDSSTNDHKIVRAMMVSTVLKVEVFSLNSYSWRSLSDFKPKFVINWMLSPVYVNGRVHWLVADDKIRNLRVLLFHFADEIFWEAPVPECLSDKFLKLSVVPYGDSSVALVQGIDHHGFGSFKQSQVWVMKENIETGSSWTKVGVMPSEHIGDAWRKLLRFKNSAEVMVMQSRGEIALVDLISAEIKQLGLGDNTHSDCFLRNYVEERPRGVGDSMHSFCFSHDCNERDYNFLGTYVESLALLDKNNNAGDETSDSDDEWGEISVGDETSDSDMEFGDIGAGDETSDSDAESREISGGDETNDSDAEVGNISSGDETSDSEAESGADETSESEAELRSLRAGDETSDGDAERGKGATFMEHQGGFCRSF